MAAATIGPELAIVLVVIAMTVDASASEPDLVLERPAMAGVAGDVGMSTGQGEFGLAVVVENPLSPVDRVVAKPAGFVEAPVVTVVPSMTADAFGCCVGKNVRVVTAGTLRVPMPAKQGEGRQPVIEKDLVVPGLFVVTVPAG